MIEGLRPWVECESPTFAAAAVDRMIDLAAGDLAAMGATIERMPGRLGFGGCVRARFPHADAGAPGILIAGHMDTVHPIGTLAQLPWRRDGDRCFGPGILDMKGGNYMTLEAIRQLARAGIATPLPVTVLFTSDEEVGTPSTRTLIETEMARQILAIDAMTSEDCTFSVGVVHGGQWVNCVASRCTAEALSMAKRQEDLDGGVEKMLALAGTRDDVTFAVTRGVTRPVWRPALPGTMALYETARGIAQSLGASLP